MELNHIAKCILNSNSYLAEIVYKVCAKKYNSIMSNFVKEISIIDSIRDIDSFNKKLRDMPNSWHNTSNNYKNSYSENTLYGYANEVMKYADIDIEEMFYMPILEHGISYNGILELSRYNIHRPYIFQGKSSAVQWGKISKKKAYFIGPFIHYSSYYYNDVDFYKIKNELGRVALVFLPHSVEFDDFAIHIDQIISKYASQNNLQVDTVMVCVYYTDLSDELVKAIEGIAHFKLVCAGFKLDPLFVRRLKTILQLSDICFFNSFSSSIGYAYYLGKQIVPDIDEIERKRFGEKYGEGGRRQLETFEKCFSEDDEELQKSFIENLWGISEIKTADQIRGLFNEAKKEMIRGVGF